MKTVSKLALAVTLMMGNIEFNTTQTDFYEDDSDFLQVSSVLETGWGWSLSKAHANSNDCSGEEGSEARECEEEVIEVIGTYAEDSSFGDVFGDTSYDGGGGDSGSDAGGGGADENMTDEERLAKVERDQECMRESIALEKSCLKNPTETLNDLYFVCNLLSTGIGAANVWAGMAAAAVCYKAYRHDLEVLDDSCQANVEEAMETCY